MKASSLTTERLIGTATLLVLLLLTEAGRAEEGDPGAPPQAIARWQDMRFGMFIHRGAVSLQGTEICWSRGREILVEDYDALHLESLALLPK